MYNIQTKNVIAERGLEVLTQAGCAVGPEVQSPDALLIRCLSPGRPSFDPIAAESLSVTEEEAEE